MTLATIVIDYHAEFPDWLAAGALVLVGVPFVVLVWLLWRDR